MIMIADYDDMMQRLANVRQTVEDARRTMAAQKKVIETMREALKPFADYADRAMVLPPTFQITTGSSIARVQLTLGDCYGARAALALAEGR